VTDTPLALHCKDYSNRTIVFKQDSFDEHRARHAELDQPEFFPARVINALKNPTFTVRGHRNNTRCPEFPLKSQHPGKA